MSKKHSRAGGKYSGNHSTLIPLAALVCDIVHTASAVTRISPGFIKAGLRSVSGKRRVKVRMRETGFQLSVRDNTSHQELEVYATDSVHALLELKNRLKLLHVSIATEK